MSRKSHTVMFRSTDDPVDTIETKPSMPVKLYLKLRYTRRSVVALCGLDVRPLFEGLQRQPRHYAP
jgi:hypothetical protein